MKAILNEKEQRVFGNAVAISENENGLFFNFEDLVGFDLDNTEKQLKGYISQLIQKGFIVKLEDSYYDFEIINQ